MRVSSLSIIDLPAAFTSNILGACYESAQAASLRMWHLSDALDEEPLQLVKCTLISVQLWRHKQILAQEVFSCHHRLKRTFIMLEVNTRFRLCSRSFLLHSETWISQRGKEAGIYPEPDVDAFMKVLTCTHLAITTLRIPIESFVNSHFKGKMSIEKLSDILLRHFHSWLSSGLCNVLYRWQQFSEQQQLRTSACIVIPVSTSWVSLCPVASSALSGRALLIFCKRCGLVCFSIIALNNALPEDSVLYCTYHFKLSAFENDEMHVGKKVTSRKDQEQYRAITHRPYRSISVREFSLPLQEITCWRRNAAGTVRAISQRKKAIELHWSKRHAVSRKELFMVNFAKGWVLYKRIAKAQILKVAYFAHENWMYARLLVFFVCLKCFASS